MICLSAATVFVPSEPKRQDPITAARDPGVLLVGTAPGRGGEGLTGCGRSAVEFRGC